MNLLNEWEENLESHEIEIQAQNKYTYSHCLLVLVHGFEKITWVVSVQLELYIFCRYQRVGYRWNLAIMRNVFFIPS